MGSCTSFCELEEVGVKNELEFLNRGKRRVVRQRTLTDDDIRECPPKRVRLDNKSFELRGRRNVSSSVAHLQALERHDEKGSFSEKFFDETSIIPRHLSSTRQMMRIATIKSYNKIFPHFSQGSDLFSRNDTFRSQLISDWAGAYEDFDTPLSNSHQSFNTLQTDDNDSTFFSENDHISSTEKTMSMHSSEIQAMQPQPGMVFAMCLFKEGQRFKWLNLCTSLEDVVATFLSTDNKSKLPVSVTELNEARPRIYGRSRMAMTLAENLGPNFDAKTQALMFSTGPVNSKLCHKMSVCDLLQMQKIFYQTAKNKCSSVC